jgi:hypothetical protein
MGLGGGRQRRSSAGRRGDVGGSGQPVAGSFGSTGLLTEDGAGVRIRRVELRRFLDHSGLGLGEVVATDVFDWLAWQREPLPSRGRRVFVCRRGGARRRRR